MINQIRQPIGTATDTAVSTDFPLHLPVQNLITATTTLESLHMSKTDTKPSVFTFDLNALRLPVEYGVKLEVKKILSNVPVGRPHNQKFFRTHTSPSMTFNAILLTKQGFQERYLVMPDIAQEIRALVQPNELQAAIDRQGNIFLVPIPLPGRDGKRHQWHESLAKAMEAAKTEWTRIEANVDKGCYDFVVAQGVLEQPEWPDYGLDELVEVAFRGRIINDLEHSVIQSLMGKI